MSQRIVEMSVPKENKVNFQLLWEQVSKIWGVLFSLDSSINVVDTVVKSVKSTLLFPSRVKSQVISTSNRFACESCKVRADRPSTPFIISLVPHFMTLIFPTMPHYTTTYRAAPALSHWSWRLPSTLKFKKTRASLPNHEIQLQPLFIWWMKDSSSKL